MVYIFGNPWYSIETYSSYNFITNRYTITIYLFMCSNYLSFFGIDVRSKITKKNQPNLYSTAASSLKRRKREGRRFYFPQYLLIGFINFVILFANVLLSIKILLFMGICFSYYRCIALFPTSVMFDAWTHVWPFIRSLTLWKRADIKFVIPRMIFICLMPVNAHILMFCIQTLLNFSMHDEIRGSIIVFHKICWAVPISPNLLKNICCIESKSSSHSVAAEPSPSWRIASISILRYLPRTLLRQIQSHLSHLFLNPHKSLQSDSWSALKTATAVRPSIIHRS